MSQPKGSPAGAPRASMRAQLIVPLLLLLVSGTDAAKISCDFDDSNTDFCSFTTGTSNKAWLHKSGSTPSSITGPSSSYSGSYYLYTEASSPNEASNFDLVDEIDSDYMVNWVSFYYNMWTSSSSGMGSLKLQASTDCSSWTDVWSQSGNQGSGWKSANTSMPDSTTQYTCVRFYASSSSYKSDIGLDSVVIDYSENNAPTPNPTSTPQPSNPVVYAVHSLHLIDSYGDGWNGNYWTLDDTTAGDTFDSGTLLSGSSDTVFWTLQAGHCFEYYIDGFGSYLSEVSYTIKEADGTLLATGGGSTYTSSSPLSFCVSYPSPDPSPVPTAPPTYSRPPSPVPTPIPTPIPTQFESPEPTPGPSVHPSRAPSITQPPTLLPTPVPTAQPSISLPPTYTRTSTPSVSLAPTTPAPTTASPTTITPTANPTFLCPPGQYFGEGSCHNCAAGRFSNSSREFSNYAKYTADDALLVTDCDDCPIGRYQPKEGEAACLACPEGRYGDQPAVSANCTGCPAGTASMEVGATSEDVCEICIYGQYSWGAQAECTLCPAGTYLSDVGRTVAAHDNITDCSECAVGKVSVSDRDSCEDCNAGTYADTSDCVDCPTGTYSPNGQECFSCGAGFYTNASAGATSCSDCPAGRFSAGESAACSSCEAGYYSSPRASTCEVCDAGKYSAEAEATSCRDCAAGTHNTGTNNTECIDCTEGYFQPATGQTQCFECEAGKSVATTQATVCGPCAAGQFQALTAATSCDQCAPGTYNPASGAQACQDCAEGMYTADNGSPSCENCAVFGDGYTAVPGSTECDQCSSGYYFQSSTQTCRTCPTGCLCNARRVNGTGDLIAGTTTATLDVQHGYYRFNVSNDKVYECPHGGNCVGGVECLDGAEGPLCALCSEGYFMGTSFVDSNRCVRCGLSRDSLLPVLLTFLAGVMLLLFGWGMTVIFHDKVKQYYTNNQHFWDLFAAKLTALVVTMQIVMLLQDNHTALGGSALPSPYVTFVSWCDMMALDVLRYFGADCINDPTHVEYLICWTTLPLAGLVLTVLMAGLRQAEKALSRYMAVYVQVLLMFLPVISRSICESFRCTNFEENGSFLAVDYAVDCDSQKYDRLTLYAVVTLLVYPVGVPLVVWTQLWRLRHRLDPVLDESELKHVTSFYAAEHAKILKRDKDTSLDDASSVAWLARQHRPRYYWYEVYNMLRRLTLTSVPLLFNTSAGLIVFVLLVSLFTTVIERELRAQIDPYLSAFEYVMHWQIVMCILAMLLMDADMTRMVGNFVLGSLLLGVNMLMMLTVVLDTRSGQNLVNQFHVNLERDTMASQASGLGTIFRSISGRWSEAPVNAASVPPSDVWEEDQSEYGHEAGGSRSFASANGRHGSKVKRKSSTPRVRFDGIDDGPVPTSNPMMSMPQHSPSSPPRQSVSVELVPPLVPGPPEYPPPDAAAAASPRRPGRPAVWGRHFSARGNIPWKNTLDESKDAADDSTATGAAVLDFGADAEHGPPPASPPAEGTVGAAGDYDHHAAYAAYAAAGDGSADTDGYCDQSGYAYQPAAGGDQARHWEER